MKFKILAFICAFFGCSSVGHAIDIPLSGGFDGDSQGKIGYVDMDLIFQVYPQTRYAKEDYAKQLKVKREELESKEKELQGIRERIAVIESTLKGAVLPDQPVDTSTDSIDGSDQIPAGTKPTSVGDMRAELRQKEAEYEEARQRAVKDLAAFESLQSQKILGNIYQALKDLAEEEQITLVVDKSSILYGSATIDLTDRLQEKVRGY